MNDIIYENRYKFTLIKISYKFAYEIKLMIMTSESKSILFYYPHNDIGFEYKKR